MYTRSLSLSLSELMAIEFVTQTRCISQKFFNSKFQNAIIHPSSNKANPFRKRKMKCNEALNEGRRSFKNKLSMWNESIIIELLAAHFMRHTKPPFRIDFWPKSASMLRINTTMSEPTKKKHSTICHRQQQRAQYSNFVQQNVQQTLRFFFLFVWIPRCSLWFVCWNTEMSLLRVMQLLLRAYWAISTREHTGFKLLFPVCNIPFSFW